MSQPTTTPLTTLDAIFTRRSVRAYTSQAVDEATIRALLDAAVAAPTAMHMEPWSFVVVQDADLLQRYSELAKASWIKEAAKYQELHPSRSTGGFAARAADPAFSIFHGARTLIVICAKPLGPFITADCWLAAENLMLAACALGLGTCCIGSAVPALNTPEAKAELHIPPDVTAVAPIVVGVPAADSAGVPRKDPEILSWKK